MVTTKGVPKTPAGSASGNARQAAAPTAAASDARAAVAPGRLLRVTHDTEYLSLIHI